MPDAACEALARLETLVLRGNRLQVLPDAIAKFQASRVVGGWVDGWGY